MTKNATSPVEIESVKIILEEILSDAQAHGYFWLEGKVSAALAQLQAYQSENARLKQAISPVAFNRGIEYYEEIAKRLRSKDEVIRPKGPSVVEQLCGPLCPHCGVPEMNCDCYPDVIHP